VLGDGERPFAPSALDVLEALARSKQFHSVDTSNAAAEEPLECWFAFAAAGTIPTIWS